MKQPATLLIAALVVFAWTTVAGAGSPSDDLAGQIKNQVYQFVNEGPSTGPSPSVAEFEQLVSTASWSEIWPSAGGGEATQAVTAGIWNNAIQATLDKYGTVYLPKTAAPYYIDNPIVLKSGQRLCADPDAEIRLRPGVNTCMVRNENIVSGQSGPPPAAKPDTGIIVEGGIWTTLATTPSQSNGNTRGRSDQQNSVPGSHGVILMSNVDGLVTRNLTIRQSMAHGIQVSNCNNFLVDGIAFDEQRRDGVHVNGSASYGIIRNISGDTYDDVVALNAWDWLNATPTFGQIDHVVVENIHGDPVGNSSDEIRLLPGNKTFADQSTLNSSIKDCVLRDLYDIRTVKMYDQPNLELGRNVDFSDPIGTIKNVYFDNLVYNRPGRFQVAANVEGVSVNNVQLNYDVNAPANSNAKLVEVGPMSMTFKFNGDPSSWVEVFSPDRDITVSDFHLTNVTTQVGADRQPLSGAEARLVQVASQKLNPNYPNTTPRGGTGKVKLVGCLISASVANPSFETGVGNSALPTDWFYEGNVRACQEVATLGGLETTASGSHVLQLNAGDNASVYAYQDLPTDFAAGTAYTLTVALGMRNDHIGNADYADSMDWTLSFNYSDTGKELARLSGTILNDATHTGFLTDQTLRYIANAADASHGIQIRIFGSTVGKNSGGLAGCGLLSVDNVRLEGAAVPEPSSLMLLSAALLGLVIYCYKRAAR